MQFQLIVFYLRCNNFYNFAFNIDRTLVHIDTQNLLSYAYRFILMIKYTSYDMVNMMGSLVDIIC
jgi:hypothetical protein